MYLAGMGVMSWNVIMTVRSGRPAVSAIPRLAAA
jgi:cbb3-type cytochrome oxidase subunit 1